MFIFLYGADTFRSRRKLNELIKEYQAKHKSGLNFIRLVDFDSDKLKTAVAVSPMFYEKKLIVLENIFQQADAEFFDYFQQKDLENDKNIILLIWEGGAVDKKNELFNMLVKKPNLSEEFIPLNGMKLLNWIKKETNERNGKIGDETLKKLAGLANGDSHKLDNEINQLIAYRRGQPITAGDVDLFVSGKITNNVFNTIDALGELNKKRAMALIQKHLSEGEDEFYLLSMLAYQFRNLLGIKDGLARGLSGEAIIKKTGLHPFVYKKSLAQAKNFTYEQLKNIYRRLLKIDTSAKTGKVEPKLAIEVLIAEL